MASRIKIGDHVRPLPEWVDSPCCVPTGRVVKIEPWGKEGAIRVEGCERLAFAGGVFEIFDPLILGQVPPPSETATTGNLPPSDVEGGR